MRNQAKGAGWVIAGFKSFDVPSRGFRFLGNPLFKTVAASTIRKGSDLSFDPDRYSRGQSVSLIGILRRFFMVISIKKDSPSAFFEIVLEKELTLGAQRKPPSARLKTVRVVASPSHCHSEVSDIVGGRSRF
jgi:hypothetical protein